MYVLGLAALGVIGGGSYIWNAKAFNVELPTKTVGLFGLVETMAFISLAPVFTERVYGYMRPFFEKVKLSERSPVILNLLSQVIGSTAAKVTTVYITRRTVDNIYPVSYDQAKVLGFWSLLDALAATIYFYEQGTYESSKSI